jgi:hypothetical protein
VLLTIGFPVTMVVRWAFNAAESAVSSRGWRPEGALEQLALLEEIRDSWYRASQELARNIYDDPVLDNPELVQIRKRLLMAIP